MLHSKVVLIRQVDSLMLLFPSLVKRLEQKDPSFISALLDWIERAENILGQHRIAKVAQLSALKAKLLAPNFSGEVSRSRRRKSHFLLASELAFDIQASVQEAVAPFAQKVEQASALVTQLSNIIAQTNRDNGQSLRYERNTSLDDFARKLWALIVNHEQLKNSAVQLKSLLHEQDIILLISQEVDLSDYSL